MAAPTEEYERELRLLLALKEERLESLEGRPQTYAISDPLTIEINSLAIEIDDIETKLWTIKQRNKSFSDEYKSCNLI